MVKTPRIVIHDSFEIVLSTGPSFPIITTEVSVLSQSTVLPELAVTAEVAGHSCAYALQDCDTPTHRQVQPQRFHFDKTTVT